MIKKPLSGLVLLLGAQSSVLAEPLKVPFLLRPADAIKQRDAQCRAYPAPVTSLSLVSRYGDDGPERDDVDEEAEKAYEEAFKPIKDWLAAIVRHANRFTEKGRSGDAKCAGDAMLAWINGGALGELSSHTDYFKLATTLNGLSVSYLQIRSGLPESEKALIERWLRDKAILIRDHFESLPKPRSRANNHRYWGAAGVAMAGLAANRADLVEWGLGSFEMGVCSADRQGVLPHEIIRGKKAREYHLFALGPLALLAEIGAANGRNTYGICRNAFANIVNFTLASVTKPEAMEKLAGHPQAAFAQDKDLPPASSLAFLEPYVKRFPDALSKHTLIETSLPGLRPLRLTDLGGDLSLLFLGPAKKDDTADNPDDEAQ
jgi:poly(beta-D-mannuronate) lyase